MLDKTEAQAGVKPLDTQMNIFFDLFGVWLGVHKWGYWIDALLPSNKEDRVSIFILSLYDYPETQYCFYKYL